MSSQSPTHSSLVALKLAATELVGNNKAAILVCPDSLRCRQLKQELDFLLGAGRSRFFPDYESLPYDRLPVSGSLISDRLALLGSLIDGWSGLLLATPASLLQFLPARDWLAGNSIRLERGQELSLEGFAARLADSGYRPCPVVESPGDFTRRGALIDFFPSGQKRPLRIEFLDQTLETMRWFDAKTQRSIEPVDSIEFVTGREMPLDEAGIACFRRAFRTEFDCDETLCPVFGEVSDGGIPDGLEYYLPLFFARPCLLTDYLPDATLVMLPGAARAVTELKRTTRDRYQLLRHDSRHPLLRPEQLFAFGGQLQAAAKAVRSLQELAGQDGWRAGRGDVLQDPQSLNRWAGRNPQGRVLCCAPSAGALAAVQARLKTALPAQLVDSAPVCGSWRDFLAGDAPLAFARSALTGHCRSHGAAPLLVVGATADLSASAAAAKRTSGDLFAQMETDAAAAAERRLSHQLTANQLVVHPKHGLGRYLGLRTLDTDGVMRDLAAIEYRNQAVLYLPVEDIGLLHPYRTPAEPLSEAAEPALARLGSDAFAKSRSKAEVQARDDAARLLATYASRQAASSDRLRVDDGDFAAFLAEFPFTETPDQAVITRQIRASLAEATPTNLLICGDVGFGKTEVAMRAAFIAAMAGRQCCVLAPTTLLCQQHHRNFSERMAGWPVRIGRLDSTLTAAERDRLHDQLHRKAIDILISTHAVLRGSWSLPNLALFIIDEEHRFGVNDKERSRDFQVRAHCLSMTATPIPRSLHRSLSGLHDIAIMGTPPPGRLPVQTFVREWDEAMVREALRRERLRGGQVFVVHDRISTLGDIARMLQELVPEASLAMAHGRMPPQQLQEVMRLYTAGDIDILLSTTIVESGIDVPNANTLLVTRADRMGLAQLHQLRGRVGRASQQAWCWFFHPGEAELPDSAKRRLEAIERADTLGSGLALAQEDLEIRGAGELLGREQSGQVQRVGMDMYLAMLEKAIGDIRSGRAGSELEDEGHSCEIDLGDSALLPESYVADAWERVLYYRRLSTARDFSELKRVRGELRDRFGPLPDETHNLLRNARLRIRARQLGGKRLVSDDRECTLEVHNRALNPEMAIALAQKYPQDIRITPKSLRAKARGGDDIAALPEATAEWLLDRMTQEQRLAR